MKQVTFGEVPMGGTFTYKNNEYIKIQTKKITCCKFTNAHLTTDTSKKIGLRPGEMVGVAE